MGFTAPNTTKHLSLLRWEILMVIMPMQIRLQIKIYRQPDLLSFHFPTTRFAFVPVSRAVIISFNLVSSKANLSVKDLFARA